jgi:hypothetical protein
MDICQIYNIFDIALFGVVYPEALEINLMCTFIAA